MNWLKKRILALEARLVHGETILHFRDGSTFKCTGDGQELLEAFADSIHGKPSPLADKIGESIAGNPEHGLVSIIRLMKAGPISREAVEAGESEKPEHGGMN